MAFSIPKTLTTWPERMAYALAAQEKLRRLHNTPGRGDAPDWKREVFRPANMAVGQVIVGLRRKVPTDVAKEATADKRIKDGKLALPAEAKTWGPRSAWLVAIRQHTKARGILDDEAERLVFEAYQAAKFSPDQSDLDAVDLRLSRVASDPLPDPAEDLGSDYTEVDPATCLSVSGTQVSVTLYDGASASYLYKDFGASHFGTSLEIDFEANCSGYQGSGGGHVSMGGFSLSNTLGGAWSSWGDGFGSGIWAGTSGTAIGIIDAPAGTNDLAYPLSLSTTYYCTLNRSGASASVEIYSDSGRTTLVDTVVETLSDGSSQTYRYGYACCPIGGATGKDNNFLVDNIDLHEGPTGLEFFPWHVRSQQSSLIGR